MSTVFCSQCERETEHVRIYIAQRLASVSRPTIYRWIEKDWVHVARLPSGVTVVCRDFLVSPPMHKPIA